MNIDLSDVNCWTATLGGIAPGILVEDGAVVLGEAGRGRAKVVIGIRDVPAADVKQGRVMLASLNGEARRFGRWVENAPELVRFTTGRAYSKGTSGFVEVFGGAVVVAQGRHAHGDAGRAADGPDAIVALPAGGLVYARWTGRAEVRTRTIGIHPQTGMPFAVSFAVNAPPEAHWTAQGFGDSDLRWLDGRMAALGGFDGPGSARERIAAILATL